MKTLKELREHGINYLIGYTDAIADFANMLIDPSLYDGKHCGILLNYITLYLDRMIKESMDHESSAAN